MKSSNILIQINNDDHHHHHPYHDPGDDGDDYDDEHTDGEDQSFIAGMIPWHRERFLSKEACCKLKLFHFLRRQKRRGCDSTILTWSVGAN